MLSDQTADPHTVNSVQEQIATAGPAWYFRLNCLKIKHLAIYSRLRATSKLIKFGTSKYGFSTEGQFGGCFYRGQCTAIRISGVTAARSGAASVTVQISVHAPQR